jgi:two-component system sensor histidine kinase/response regulator
MLRRLNTFLHPALDVPHRRLAGPRCALDRVRGVLQLTLFAAALSTTVSATIGVTSLCIWKVAPWPSFDGLRWTWWLGDALGVVIVTPLLLALRDGARPALTPRALVEGAALLAAAAALSLMVFDGRLSSPGVPYPLAFLPLPIVVWAALRFGSWGVVLTALVTCGVALWETASGHGPFARATPQESFVLWALFAGVMTVPGLLLAAVTAERRQAAERVRARLTVAEALNTVSRSLTTDRSLPDLLQAIADGVAAALSADRVALINFDLERREVLHFVRAGRGADVVVTVEFDELWQGLSGWVLRERRPALSPKGHPDARESAQVRQRRADTDCGAIVVVPMWYREQMLGTLTVINRPDGSDFTAQDVELLTAIASQAAVAVENARLVHTLRESEERFRTMADSAPVMMWITDADQTRTYVNRRWLDFTGRTWDQERGLGWTEGISTDDVERCTPIYVEAFEARTPFQIEHRLRHHGGECLWVFVTGVPRFTANGAFLGYIGSCVDIDARKRVEAALKLESDRMQALMDYLPDAIYFKDVGSRFTRVSKYVHLRGIASPEEAIGKTDFDFFTDEHAREAYDDEQRIMQTGEPLIDKVEKETFLDGTVGWVLTTKVPVRDARGQVTGLIGASRDITDRVRMEAALAEARDAALESVRLKSAFLANMSHEIRTPMNGIVGMTELLLDTRLTDEQRDYVATISSSGDALLAIINDILDFSKIEAGKLTLEIIDFDVHQVLKDLVDLLAERAHAKNVDLVLLSEEDVPAILGGDSGRLRQVLTNLVSNAVKFTAHGEVALRVAVVSEEDAHVLLRFTVRDTGIGIGPQALGDLFEPFTQADGSTTRQYGGTGLGLAIARQLVTLMEGTLSVQSTLGEGSTFAFTARFGKQAGLAQAPPAWRPELEGLRVLVVDDTATARAALVGQLARQKVLGAEAENGRRALDVLRAGAARGEPYDLAILDLRMPGMGGFELARAIKADAALACVRLVLMPTVGVPGHGERARAAGISAYLTKPARPSEIFACLAAVMAMDEEDVCGPVAKLVTRHTLTAAGAAHDRPAGDGWAGTQAGADSATLLARGRILVVEDNPVNQRVVLGHLAKLGYRADIAAGGLEALGTLANASYDLVLMDCQMPEMDGYAATEEIRRREGSVRHTTIIAITASAIEGDRERCLAAGMDDYLSKPVKRADLQKMLARWVAPSARAIPAAGPQRAAPDGEAPPVDVAQLSEAADNDPEMIRDLITLYLESTPELLNRLQEAVEVKATAQVAQLAHRLRGGSATCGMVAIVPALRELERRGSENDLSNAAVLVGQARAAFERIRRFLEESAKEVPG